MTELAEKALSNVSQYKDHCTEKQFKTIEDAISGHNTNLMGVGFYAIQAKLKLTEIAKLDLPNFIESVKYI